MTTGILPKQLPIQHMRNHRQRMPVGRRCIFKRSNDSLQGQTGLRKMVLRHIQIVIVTDKVKVLNIPVDPKGQDD